MADASPPGDPRPTEGAGATSRLLDELLAEGVPIAEIAVRLGISVPDAHARIARASGTAPPGLTPRPATTPPAATPRPATPPRRRLSRRALLALTAAGIASAATGGAFLATRETRSPEVAARPPRPIPAPPTLTPVPPPLADLRPATGLFEPLDFEAGAPLTAAHGLFFLRTRGESAGAVSGWRLADADADEPPVYRASDGGRFVTAANALLDRRSGQSWSWPGDRLRLVGLSDDAALFEELEPVREFGLARRARYILTDDQLEVRAQFELPGVRLPATPPVFEPGGRRVFLALQQPRSPALFMLDGATGHATGVLSPQPQHGPHQILFDVATLASDGNSFLFPFSYWPIRSPRPPGYGSFATFVAHLSWTGEHLEITRVHVDRVFPAPDGSLMAGERVLPIPGTNPPEFEETSTVLIFDGRTGALRFRINSARLNYGDELGGARWLADSSALVVQTRMNGKGGYSLVSADGSRIEPLPDPPPAAGQWFRQHDVRGAVPAPDDPSLVAFGRADLYDRAADRWLGVNPTAAPAHLGPWSPTRSDEAVLALPHRDHRHYPLLADLHETSIELINPVRGDDA